jgi:hypothetical protein
VQQSLVISKQFNGPPRSANGGYASGLLANGLYAAGYHGAVEAYLHVPPPLDAPLTLDTTDLEAVLLDGETRVGTAKPAILDLHVPHLSIQPETIGKPVTIEGAFEQFDQCFVCGEARGYGDGLCLHAEVVKGAEHGMVYTPWSIHPSFCAKDGFVDPIYIWSALDCPGYYSCAFGEAALLARLTTEMVAPLKGGEAAHVFGWTLEQAGAEKSRKRRCGTAVLNAAGELVAKAEGLWIVVDPAKIKG